MKKFKVTAYTTRAYDIVVEAETPNEALNIASDTPPDNWSWKENHQAGGGWEIPDKPQELV